MHTKTCSELLLSYGIDFSNQTVTDNIIKNNTIVFLDDAQAKYEDANFWMLLIKLSPNWLPVNIRFIISSTHLLAGGIESPVELRSIVKLERSDFLLSKTESFQLLDFPVIGLPEKMRSQTLDLFI